MTLSALIKKGGLAHVATATHATLATHETPTVATVAVADTPRSKTVNPEISQKIVKVDNFDLASIEFQERAGIIAGNPDIPKQWIEGMAVLVSMPLPELWTQPHWDTVLINAENFMTKWGAQAHRLGWSVNDLFGLSQSGSCARIDRLGLVLLLDDKRVTYMTDETAALQCLNIHTGEPNESILTFYRKPDMSGSIPVWQLTPRLTNANYSAHKPLI